MGRHGEKGRGRGEARSAHTHGPRRRPSPAGGAGATQGRMPIATGRCGAFNPPPMSPFSLEPLPASSGLLRAPSGPAPAALRDYGDVIRPEGAEGARGGHLAARGEQALAKGEDAAVRQRHELRRCAPG